MSVLFIVCNGLISTHCLTRCLKVLTSIHNILRKERASILCGWFRYLLFHIHDLSPEKLVMCDLDMYGKFHLGMLPDILFDICFFSLLVVWLLHFFLFWLCGFFHNYFRVHYLNPKTQPLQIFPVIPFKWCS